jgi:hypothetical protein
MYDEFLRTDHVPIKDLKSSVDNSSYFLVQKLKIKKPAELRKKETTTVQFQCVMS